MAGRATRRSRRIALAALAVLVVGFVGLTVRLFVYPDLNTPERSDAIAVLGGNGDGPDRTGLELARHGYAPTVVFSINPSQSCDALRAALPHLRVICFFPQPNTTQGEARAIGHLAASEGWHRIIVVMPTTQATRARLRVGWCYPGQVLEVGFQSARVRQLGARHRVRMGSAGQGIRAHQRLLTQPHDRNRLAPSVPRARVVPCG